MPLNLVYHKVPPSCWLAIPEKERKGEPVCTCEGVKHDEDWVKLKPKLSYGEKLDLSERLNRSATEGLCWMLERFIAEWSLRDTSTRLVNGVEGAKGEPLPIAFEAIYDLDEETADYIASLTDRSRGEDPKASGRRSPKR